MKDKELKFHTAVDTAGNVPRETFKEKLPYVDLFLYDIKTLDDQKHKEATGSSNRRIVENLNWLAAQAVEIRVRVPVIPSFNDCPNQIKQIRSLVETLRR